MIQADDHTLTNLLLIEEAGLWDLFDSKSISADQTKRYYQLIDSLIDSQIGESIAWLQSDEAKKYFFEEAELQKEIFDALEDSWDTIFDEHYKNVDKNGMLMICLMQYMMKVNEKVMRISGKLFVILMLTFKLSV